MAFTFEQKSLMSSLTSAQSELPMMPSTTFEVDLDGTSEVLDVVFTRAADPRVLRDYEAEEQRSQVRMLVLSTCKGRVCGKDGYFVATTMDSGFCCFPEADKAGEPIVAWRRDGMRLKYEVYDGAPLYVIMDARKDTCVTPEVQTMYEMTESLYSFICNLEGFEDYPPWVRTPRVGSFSRVLFERERDLLKKVFEAWQGPSPPRPRSRAPSPPSCSGRGRPPRSRSPR